MKSHKAMQFLAYFALALLCGAPLALAGEETTVDGVLHIKNSATPSQGREALELKELWRVGGEDDEDVLLGVVTQVLTDDEQKVYLLDTQLSQVHVFGPDGEFSHALSREGDGPGEVRTPIDMLIMPDANLGLLQPFPGKITKITMEDTPAGVMEVRSGDATEGGFTMLIDGNSAGGNLVLGGTYISQIPTGQARTNFIAQFSEEGVEQVRYETQEQTLDFTNFEIIERKFYFPHFRKWDVGPDGRVYAAPHRNQYLINVYAPDGTLDRVIEREYKSPRRTERQFEIVNAGMEAQQARIPGDVKTEVEDTEPDVTSISVDSEGFLWVESSRSNLDPPEGILRTYDLFDPKGHFIKQVDIACEGEGDQDGLIFAGKDRVIQVTGFLNALLMLQQNPAASGDEEEPEPMEVICYQR